ncbi:MAG TPA: hypothetical protein VFU79_04930, partial [Nitrososphaeraceae archaeon]|nr:hypothetical protein [Nitrososphaeraceae archaeon]
TTTTTTSIVATTSIVIIIIATAAATTITITRQTTVHLYNLGKLTTYTLFLRRLTKYKKAEKLIAIT